MSSSLLLLAVRGLLLPSGAGTMPPPPVMPSGAGTMPPPPVGAGISPPPPKLLLLLWLGPPGLTLRTLPLLVMTALWM